MIPFDPPQYLFPITSESLASLGVSGDVLPAGTYNITLNRGAYNSGIAEDGTYQFTTTLPIPIGGGIRHSYIGTNKGTGTVTDYSKDYVLSGTFITYGADRVTILENDLETTEGSSGINLGTTTACNPSFKTGDYINFTHRQRYGSNRWSTSFVRQYLNSDESIMTFVPLTIWSRPISQLSEGFLYTIDEKLKSVLCKVRTRYSLSISDGYGYEDIEDYVKLSTLLDLSSSGTTVHGVYEGPVNSEGTIIRTKGYSKWIPQGAYSGQKPYNYSGFVKYDGATAKEWIQATAVVNTSGCAIINHTAEGRYNASGIFASEMSGIAPSMYIELEGLNTISWKNDVGTIYGGTLNVSTGELLVTHLDVSNEMQTTAYVTGSTSSDWVQGCFTPSNQDTVLNLVWSDRFSSAATSGTIGKMAYITSGNAKRVFFNIPRSELAGATSADIRDWLQSNGVQCILKFASPIVYNLIPQEIKTVYKNNNFIGITSRVYSVIPRDISFADPENVSIEYRADPTLMINKKVSELMVLISE